MNATHPLPRLYAILDVERTEARGLDPIRVLDIWLGAGVRLIQLRAKHLAGGRLLDLAGTMARRVEGVDATFIVNDRADIARLAGAGGVHVGQEDLSPGDVREILGDSPIVGLSTHTARQVAAAVNEPISYLAIGPVFATGTKRSRDAIVGLDAVRAAAKEAAVKGLPIVGIGGITLATAADVLAAGAHSIAVISDLLIGDPAARAREFVEALG